MAIAVSGISVTLPGGGEQIKEAAAKRLGIREEDIACTRVKRQSLDCRKKDIRLVYTLHVTLGDAALQSRLEAKYGSAEDYTEPHIEYGTQDAGRVVVVGAGPCGLFAALTLARHGYKPLLIERGKSIDERSGDVESLMRRGELDEESNVCFGAGGAGAFSDGKLTTRIKDRRAEHVIETLADFGAPEEIRYEAKPHTGTENIRKAVKNMTARIEELGGEVCFSCKLSGIHLSQGALARITYIKGGGEHSIDTCALILATGHSARDTYEMLSSNGIVLIPKPFAIGLRIEHRREFVDSAQYGEAVRNPLIGAAEYRLTGESGGRSVYTFCMCPGGEVICSATERGALAVNGMSYYARDAENSNSAIVVSVGPHDFAAGPLGGVEFQRIFERAAYSQTFAAPVQTVGDFLHGRVSTGFGDVTPSYRPGTYFKDLGDCLPEAVSGALKAGITQFGRKMKGFDTPGAVLTGVETRTSAPVRILRGSGLQAEGIKGLFPAGEGAGYAGGIVSAAVDGIKCAEQLMSIYSRPQ